MNDYSSIDIDKHEAWLKSDEAKLLLEQEMNYKNE